jgi:hypothetical protein
MPMAGICHGDFGASRSLIIRGAIDQGELTGQESPPDQQLRDKIDFRLTISPSLASLHRHEQYRVEFW